MQFHETPLTLNPEDVSSRLDQLFKKYKVGGKMSVSQVKQWIYEADDEDVMAANQKYQKKFFRPFQKIADTEDFREVVNLAMHAWNVFPHKSLDGKSPQDMVAEFQKQNTDQPMQHIDPILNVGPHKIPLSEYTKIAKEIEKAQKPFRKWIRQEILPEYQRFLAEHFVEKTAEKHHEVADLFLTKALSAGYVHYEDITIDFAWWFCDWWPTHVMFSDLEPKQVWNSLVKFLDFVTMVTGMDITDEDTQNGNA